MEIEGLSGIDQDQWNGRSANTTTCWNGREIRLLERDNDWIITSQSIKAQLMGSSDYSVSFCKNTHQSTTEQSVGGDINVKKDHDGTKKASVEAHYQVTSKNDKGNRDTLKVEARAEVNEKGQTSAQATVKYEKKF